VERFSVEGSTRFGWTITVDARGPAEAAKKAKRIASRMDIPGGPLRLQAIEHVVRCCDSRESECESATALSVEIW
jgi:hypothetical protein